MNLKFDLHDLTYVAYSIIDPAADNLYTGTPHTLWYQVQAAMRDIHEKLKLKYIR